VRAGRLVSVAAILVSIAVIVGPPAPAGTSLVVLDVGQGDSILVRDGTHALLVDAGPEPSALRSALARNHVRSLESLLITHLHDDHYGGAPALGMGIGLDRLIVSRGLRSHLPPALSRLKSPISEVGPSDVLRQEGAATVLAAEDRPEGGNESSIVLLLSGGFKALLTGDGSPWDRAARVGGARGTNRCLESRSPRKRRVGDCRRTRHVATQSRTRVGAGTVPDPTLTLALLKQDASICERTEGDVSIRFDGQPSESSQDQTRPTQPWRH
jgi:competence protein ComEC